jgi:DNA repair photolyase
MKTRPSAAAPDAAPDGDASEPSRAKPTRPIHGRGATFNPENRFRRDSREAVDDGWATPAGADAVDAAAMVETAGTCDAAGDFGARAAGVAPPVADDELPPLRTTVSIQQARTIISRNASPDIPFTQSINPYQGCEHGCVYCYARPSHAYLDLSPGLDFETKLFAKPNAAALLRAELAKPGYVCDPIALGTNTDPYQPIEREWKVTRSILEVLVETGHPFSIVTKSALVERDLDLIAPMAARNLARVYVSVTTLDRQLARTLEPRAAAPQRRLATIRALSQAGVPVGVMVAPIIPQLNDRDLEAILEAAAAAGVRHAGWLLLRLPREVAPLFREWLDVHHPLRAGHVMSLVRQLRGGRDNDPRFGARMRGSGPYADLIERRFALACGRLGLTRDREPLDRLQFRPPAVSASGSAARPTLADHGGGQLDLF